MQPSGSATASGPRRTQNSSVELLQRSSRWRCARAQTFKMRNTYTGAGIPTTAGPGPRRSQRGGARHIVTPSRPRTANDRSHGSDTQLGENRRVRGLELVPEVCHDLVDADSLVGPALQSFARGEGPGIVQKSTEKYGTGYHFRPEEQIGSSRPACLW